jgi:hypothetical protein
MSQVFLTGFPVVFGAEVLHARLHSNNKMSLVNYLLPHTGNFLNFYMKNLRLLGLGTFSTLGIYEKRNCYPNGLRTQKLRGMRAGVSSVIRAVIFLVPNRSAIVKLASFWRGRLSHSPQLPLQAIIPSRRSWVWLASAITPDPPCPRTSE